MAPFQYVAPENRNANSIAALMLRPGEIEAQRATQVAQAQGHAAEVSGQAWAGAAQNIGQGVSSAIQQATDPRRQLENAQLADLKRVQASRPILANAIKQFSDPQGGVDHEKVAQTLSAAGFPDQAESWLKMSAANAESLGKLRESTTKHAQEQAAAIGDLAFHAQNAQDFNSALGLAAASGLIDEAGAHRFAAQTDAAGPEGWQALKAKFQQYSPTWKTQQADQQKLHEIPEGGTLANAAGTVKIEGKPKPPTQAELAVKAAGGDAAAQVAMDRLKPTPVDSSQIKDVLLDGKPAQVMVDPKKPGVVTDLSGKLIADPAAHIKPIPPASVTINDQRNARPAGDWEKTGEDFLATIPVQWRTTVKKIANYEEDPTKVASMRSGMREQLTQWVNQVNPDYDQAQFTSRSPMRKAFTSGPQSQTVNSLNTAIGHLDQFTTVIKALDNGNFQPGNQAYNWLKTTFGSSAPTNFNGIRDIMSGELASAFKKSGATDEEIASVKSAIAQKNSTGQLLDYVNTIALPALGSKVVTFDQQYRQVMGPNDPFKILLQESESILKKHGIDPAHPQIGTNNGAGVSVTSPSGKAYPFPDQASADRFVSDAKAKGLWK